MIMTPDITEEREYLCRAIRDWCDKTPGDVESFHWRIVQLRIDLLAVSVEHAARVKQIWEDHKSVIEMLKAERSLSRER